MIFLSSAKKVFFSGVFLSIVFFFFSFVFVVQAVGDDMSVNATVPAICGNGVVEGAEGCDDGDLLSGDGCSNVCVTENNNGNNNGNNGGGGPAPAPAPVAVCGNAVLEGAEICDDGNIANGDGCSSVCLAEDAPVCGDGLKQGLEECDDGNILSGDACSNQCFLEPVCGNTVLEAGEQCDDGNVANGDGCSNVCQNEILGAACGNAVVEIGETCDDGNILSHDGCSNACRIELPMCGNGIRQEAEECDDGNVDNGDGCSALCRREVGVCGNGVFEHGEQCDDGNIQNWDGCSNLCTNEPVPVCGNGIRERGEQCDDGNRNVGDGCSLFCLREGPVGPVAPNGGGGNLPVDVVPNNDGGNGGGNVDPENNGQGQDPAFGQVEVAENLDEDENNEEVPESIFDGVKSDAPALEKIATVSNNVEKKVVAATKKLELVFFNSTKTVEEVVSQINKIADNPKVEQVAETIVAPATAAIAVAAVAPSLGTVAFPFLRLIFLQPMLLFGRKKRRAWGQIYNSLTKLPIDLAMVRLIDAKTKRVLQSRVTDMQGRYLFIAEEGDYLLEVTKAKFSFPSSLLRDEKTDGKIIDLYHGEVLSVKGTGISLTPNIPLDPIGAEKTPNRIKRDKYVVALQHVIASSGIFMTAVSLYISPVWYLWAIFAVHIVLYSMFVKFVKPIDPKGWGIVYEKDTTTTIGNTVVRLFTKKYNKLVSTQVTDRKGRYAFLVGPSDYYITFDKKGYKTQKSSDIIISEQELASIVKEDAKLEKQI